MTIEERNKLSEAAWKISAVRNSIINKGYISMANRLQLMLNDIAIILDEDMTRKKRGNSSDKEGSS